MILFVGVPTLFNSFPSNSGGGGGGKKAGVFKSSDSGSHWDLKANTNVVVQTKKTRQGQQNRQTATIGVAIDKDSRMTTEITNTNTAFKKEILDIAIDSQNSKIIYLGTKGSGLVVASDSGESWVPVIDSTKVLDQKANINKVLIDPKDHNNIYLSVFQKNYGMILRSKNSGQSFEVIYTTTLPGQEVTSLTLDSMNPNLIYFGTSSGGLFESNNYGDSWRVLRWFDSVINVILLPSKTSSFYVGTGRGLFKTDDRGQTFFELNKRLSKLDGNASNIISITVDRLNSNIVYLGTSYGLLRSKDGGLRFDLVNGLMPVNSLPIRAIEISPIDGKIIYVGAGSFIYKSVDGGLYWSVEKLPTAFNVQVIKVNPNSPKEIYLGTAE